MWQLDAVSQWLRDELQESEASPPHPQSNQTQEKAERTSWGTTTASGQDSGAPGLSSLNSYPSPGRTPLNPKGKATWPCSEHSAGAGGPEGLPGAEAWIQPLNPEVFMFCHSSLSFSSSPHPTR